MRVAFLSEGATELGTSLGMPRDEPRFRSFYLKLLIERILGTPREIEPLEDQRIPYLRGAQPGRLFREGAKILRACSLLGAEAAVIVVDRDRTPPRERWRRLLEQRRLLREDVRRPVAMPVAVGVAVETVEAWLLADEGALCRVLGLPNPGCPMASPERLDGKPGEHTHPKALLRSYLAKDCHPGRTYLEQVVAVAEAADLSHVAERCPEGFATFRDDVLAELGPRFGR